MTRAFRTLAALMFGGTLLMAQLPNPLGLPDPLGLSKSPAPSRDGRRAERKPSRERDHGKHKGQEKRGRKGHDRH